MRKRYIMNITYGVMAQLVERLVRNEEASGSNPLSSTIKNDGISRLIFCVDNREKRCIISGSREEASNA